MASKKRKAVSFDPSLQNEDQLPTAAGPSGVDDDTLDALANVDANQTRAKKRQRSGDADDDTGLSHKTALAAQEEDPDNEYNEGGVRLEGFNLKQELEDGFFDDGGNYVERRGEQEVRDAWLDGYADEYGKNEKDSSVNLASIGIKRRPSAYDESDAETDTEAVDVHETRKEMIPLLFEGETVLAALRRLGGGAKGKQNLPPSLAKASKKKFEKLTECADAMMGTGDYNIYQETKETLQERVDQVEAERYAEYQQESAELAVDDGFHWEYKWTDKPDAIVYGPFTTASVTLWIEQGFFNGENAVLIRRVDEGADIGAAAAGGGGGTGSGTDGDKTSAEGEKKEEKKEEEKSNLQALLDDFAEDEDDGKANADGGGDGGDDKDSQGTTAPGGSKASDGGHPWYKSDDPEFLDILKVS
eukprot:GFYU01001601.1.p1 GENE.GFYU01001601.1~~GFYU01001601.1.p1  ORF type:complete len:438 (-),score=121.21 GFYU01001601.1:242-1489(-)